MQIGIRDGKVAEVAFTGRGCAISQASASLLTDEVKGMTVEQVTAFQAADLLELLGIEISPARLKCAMLSLDTLDRALGELDASPAAAPPAQERA
jgi:nitrogen fixation NifU-like protein